MDSGAVWLWNIRDDCVQVSYISNSRKPIQDTAEWVKVIGTTDHPLWSI
jgi:hypothetical protein